VKNNTVLGFPLHRIGSVCLLLSALGQCWAQSAAPTGTRSLVRITQVKPEMASEWLAIQKNEVNPALKKAGVASRTVLETVLGNPYEYVSITPFSNYSELDGDNPVVKALGQEGAARLLAKTRRCIVSQSTFVSTRVEDSTSMPKTAPAVWTSARYRVNPGKNQDYENFLKTDIMPVYAKAKAAGKITGYSLSRRGPGANTRDRTMVTYSDKIASMEAGTALTQMIGQEATAKLMAKGASLASLVEVVVRKRVPDLSY
jgi:hypothetical protein